MVQLNHGHINNEPKTQKTKAGLVDLKERKKTPQESRV